MKKLSLIIFGLCFSIAASAQKIHFTDTSNVWKELDVFSTGGPVVRQYHTYNFIRDTTIDSVQYKWFNFENGFCSGCGSFIREDTILRKVYIRQYHIDTTRDSDIVLMDYNLNVGDTLAWTYYDTVHKFKYIVRGVDSTLINSVWHKVWHFSRDLGGSYVPWCDVVEGIGCIQDPTYMLQTIGVPGEYWFYMYCFSNRGITPPVSPPVFFLDNTTSCTYFPALVSIDMQQVDNSINLYPNPATTSVTISAPVNITTISITNLLGQTIYTHQYNSPQIQIDVANLPSGIYLIKINGTEVRKFVKQ